MGKAGKVRYGTLPDGETEGRKEKDEKRKRTKKRRQKMSGEARKPAEKQNKQSLRIDPQV